MRTYIPCHQRFTSPRPPAYLGDRNLASLVLASNPAYLLRPTRSLLYSFLLIPRLIALAFGREGHQCSLASRHFVSLFLSVLNSGMETGAFWGFSSFFKCWDHSGLFALGNHGDGIWTWYLLFWSSWGFMHLMFVMTAQGEQKTGLETLYRQYLLFYCNGR